jgi:hypothetical protein
VVTVTDPYGRILRFLDRAKGSRAINNNNNNNNVKVPVRNKKHAVKLHGVGFPSIKEPLIPIGWEAEIVPRGGLDSVVWREIDCAIQSHFHRYSIQFCSSLLQFL